MMNVRIPARYLTALAFAALNSACSGGSDGGGNPGPVSPLTAVASVEVTPARDSIAAGGTRTLTATPRDAAGNALSGRAVEWVSANTNIARVTQAGVVTGLIDGTITISATSEGKTGNATIVIGKGVGIPASVRLRPVAIIGAIGAPFPLAVSVLDPAFIVLSGQTVTLTSSNTGVATVDSSGVVTPLGVGSTSITASTAGLSAVSTVQIVPLTPTGPLASITADWATACGINTVGNAFCWGAGERGNLGNGGKVSSSVPLPVSGGIRFASVSASNFHSCGLGPDGDAYCWGSNGNGALGTTSDIDRVEPAPVAGGLKFSTIATGLRFTCGLTIDEKAYCWGMGQFGQLGNGGIADTSTPVQVAGGLTFKSLSAGLFHVCALGTTGAPYCWGDNRNGQIGDRTMTNASTPKAVPGGLTFSQITAGEGNNCALTSAGAAYCWGWNAHGQIGDGTTTSRPGPVPVSGNRTFKSIDTGTFVTCGLTGDGDAYCWGENARGATGNGTSIGDLFAPALVSGGLKFSTLSVGVYLTCSVTVNGVAYCWGSSDELGSSNTPRKVLGQP